MGGSSSEDDAPNRYNLSITKKRAARAREALKRERNRQCLSDSNDTERKTAELTSDAEEDEQPTVRRRRISRNVFPEKSRKGVGHVREFSGGSGCSDALIEDSSEDENQETSAHGRKRLQNHATNIPKQNDAAATDLKGSTQRQDPVGPESVSFHLDDSDESDEVVLPTRRSSRKRIPTLVGSKIPSDSDSQGGHISDREGIDIVDTDDTEDEESADENVGGFWVDGTVGAEDGSEEEVGDHDNQFSHAALNFAMDMANELESTEICASLHAHKGLETEEAFRIWTEDLCYQAESFLSEERDKRNVTSCSNHVHVSSARQVSAAGLIERRLCTHRESTLASTAWKPEFRRQLLGRPIYSWSPINKGRHIPCQACGRGCSASFDVRLSGTFYNAARTWEVKRDTRNTDWIRCMQVSTSTNRLDESDDVNINNLNPSDTVLFKLGTFCKSRTLLYHSLLHFKFKIFDRILAKLTGSPTNSYFFSPSSQPSSVLGKKNEEMNSVRRSNRLKTSAMAIVKDENFVLDGFRTYNILLRSTEGGWGLSGEGQINPYKVSLWDDPGAHSSKDSEDGADLLETMAGGVAVDPEAVQGATSKREMKGKSETKRRRKKSKHNSKESEQDDKKSGQRRRSKSKAFNESKSHTLEAMDGKQEEAVPADGSTLKRDKQKDRKDGRPIRRGECTEGEIEDKETPRKKENLKDRRVRKKERRKGGKRKFSRQQGTTEEEKERDRSMKESNEGGGEKREPEDSPKKNDKQNVMKDGKRKKRGEGKRKASKNQNNTKRKDEARVGLVTEENEAMTEREGKANEKRKRNEAKKGESESKVRNKKRKRHE